MRSLAGIVVILLALAVVQAAAPPDLINYQGVLRDAAGAPRNGSFDMTFHLYDQATAGNEIVVDRHLAASGQAVVVIDGLFNVELGSGQMLDGSGPGAYATLGGAFNEHAALWLEVEIGAEILAPRLHLASSGYALNAGALDGLPASKYVNTSSESQSKMGQLLVTSPGYGSFANLATVGFGVSAQGSSAAGSFQESDTLAQASLASGGVGILASGPTFGAFFQDLANTGRAYAGYQGNGVYAFGATRGGYFGDMDGTSTASLGEGRTGVRGVGTVPPPVAWDAGGYFEVRDSLPAGAVRAFAYLGAAVTNQSGNASFRGGYFATDLAHMEAASGEIGVYAYGYEGGRFQSSQGPGATVAGFQVGVGAYGSFSGGLFFDSDSSGDANVGYSTYKIQGTGSVAFAQNHPTRKDWIIVYNSPEGPEVATYTRGSARLVGGEARVPLDETFAWVTNPDIGLTAQLTPRGQPVALAIQSLTTEEMVVRGPSDAPPDLAFDYIVYGLRIGFEEVSIVQEKRREARIPSMADHRDRYAAQPELRRFNALERAKETRSRLGAEASLDLSASRALHDEIEEYDAKRHGPIEMPEIAHGGEARASLAPTGRTPHPTARLGGSARAADPPAMGLPTGEPDRRPAPAGEACEAPVSAETLRVSEAVSAGELLAIDPAQPDRVRRAAGIADPRFVGVAAADSAGDEVALATSRIVRVQADAAFGAIAPGDLLTTSPTPGLAMRAIDPAPGGVFGKALDALDAGSGEIRALWMPQ
jgi:hypothetical protein